MEHNRTRDGKEGGTRIRQQKKQTEKQKDFENVAG